MKAIFKSFVLILFVIPFSEKALALGYEKGIVLSGKYAGVANAAVSGVAGSESLIFNPAGLGGTDSDFVFDVTLGQVSFKAPIGTESKTADAFITPFSAVYSRKYDENFAYGIGFVVLGGLAADHGEVDISAIYDTFDPEFKSSLQIYELTLGGSYQVTDKLSVGLAYRISYASAEFSTGSASNTSSVGVKLTDLEGFDYSGVRFGVQYKETDWGVGLNFRSNVTLELEGKAEGQAETGLAVGTNVPLGTDDDVKVKSSLPVQVQLGGHYSGLENQIIRAQVGFYNYATNKDLEIDGELLLGATDVLNDITTNSKDSVAVRLGYEYLGLDMPIRAGFIYVTQVNNKAFATPGGEAPGDGYGFSLGSTMDLGENALNFAVDYSFNNAEVSTAEANTSFPGDYETVSFGLHVGYQMNF